MVPSDLNALIRSQSEQIPPDDRPHSNARPNHPVPAEAIQRLHAMIASREATIGVVGQGYVGYALAQRAAEVGFQTFGLDIDPKVLERCLAENTLAEYLVTDDPGVLRDCDVVLIAVPTPTRIEDGARHCDLSVVTSATRMLAERIAGDDRVRLVVSESTYAPGTTRKIVMPIIEQAVGRGRVAFGYSPERIDPGNERFGLSDIPKVTSGADEAAASLTTAFYRELVDDVVPASSMEAAEATKLLENTFRFVNIAFAHEFDDYCHALGMSAREITGLASTKPFGFMPFFAGPGVGGHCIAEDPYYLYDSMIAAGVPTAIIETAMVNQDERASVIVGRIQAHLGERPLQGARVLVMGVTYKPNVADTRRSPAVPVIDLLEAAGAQVDYHDPHVPSFHGRSSVDLVGAAQRYDVVAFITEHSVFDPDGMAAQGCNVFRVSGGSPAARSAAA